LDKQPYLAIEVEFTLHSAPPECNPRNQVFVQHPAGSMFFLRATFNEYQKPVHADRDLRWPDPSEYRSKLARLIANMVYTAELNSLDDNIPTFCA
jgi:hypothetical protein